MSSRSSDRTWTLGAAAFVAAYLALTLSGVGDGRPGALLLLVGVGLCGLRAAWHGCSRPCTRSLTVPFAASAALWTLGMGYYAIAVDGTPAAGSADLADVFWIASYVGLYAVVLQAARRGVGGWDAGRWLDGLVALTAIVSLGLAVLVPLIDHGSRQLLVSLAYPLADLLLVCAVLAGSSLTGGRPRPMWVLLAIGMLAQLATDVLFSIRVAETSGYHLGVPADVGYLVVFGALVAAVDVRAAVLPERRLDARTVPVLPLACAAVAVGVLTVDHFAHVALLSVALASFTLLAGLVRTAVALSANVRLQDSARHAVVDDLTGLANRRRLMSDLEAAMRRRGTHQTLALFDLDGFKSYNDTYGHPAGDALLSALGRRLRRAVEGHGEAYRLGGDEFCALLVTDAVDHDLLVAGALEALSEEGEGFTIGCSYGTAPLEEAASVTDALQTADQRMYARKDARRSSTRVQSRDLLLQILHEQQPDLEEHSGDVGTLVGAIAARLGLDAERIDRARHAAELHDVGKVAIPAAILNKPGPLDDEEWALMRRHTIIGERILGAVPALREVGRVVRSSHERWDGAGYPDGLAGDEIPLEARIIAVCDSFHAMTTDRAYRVAMPEDDALAELRRCAGTQFDPGVVEAFVAVWAEGIREPSPQPRRVPASGDAARSLAPAGAVATAATGELASLAKLRGLLTVAKLAREGAGAEEVLEATASTIASALGFRVVSVNLVRPAWDDLICTAVVGDERARACLQGSTWALDAARPLLDPRWARGGAFFIPAGAVDWSEDDGTPWHVPDLQASDDPGAWQPDDVLLVPMRSASGSGELLGLVSVDEPVFGRRPEAAELDVLVAVVDHAALALEQARAAAYDRARTGFERALADMVSRLTAVDDADEAVALLTGHARGALRFGDAWVEIVDRRSGAAPIDPLLAQGQEREGCVLLDGDAALQARRRFGRRLPQGAGTGASAWREHLVAAPLRDAAGRALLVLWADAPEDGLLPSDGVLRGLGVLTLTAGTTVLRAARAPVAAATGARAAA